MTEAEFHERVDQVFESVEMGLDDIDSDLDYENGAGVLSVTFENGVAMIFSRQPPTQQLWLATPGGGFHFVYDEAAQDWRNTRNEQLFRPFVVAQIREHGAVEFIWP